MKVRYNLIRKSNFKKYLDININNSYNFNKKIDKDSIGLIKFYDYNLISNVILKKIDAKFKYILDLMIKIEEDDSDPSEGMIDCLNELDKLNKEIMNKYRRFLDKKKQDFLEKKIIILENEIKMKLFNIQIIKNPIVMNNSGNSDEYDEKERESTRRR